MNRVQREDQSFATCYPAPVDTTGLHDPSATSQFVGWYGVLITYANYTSALLQDEDMPQEVLKKLDITFQMLVSTLELFSEVVSFMA